VVPWIERTDGIPVSYTFVTDHAESAAALAEFPGELVLKAITELPPDAAAALAKHKGRLHLTGLTAISPETRAALQGHANLLLPRQVPSGR